MVEVDLPRHNSCVTLLLKKAISVSPLSGRKSGGAQKECSLFSRSRWIIPVHTYSIACIYVSILYRYRYAYCNAGSRLTVIVLA
jgi:hypothetical protein